MRKGEWLQTEFARSLHALAPAVSADCSALAHRIEDGGGSAKNVQPADFAFFGNSGRCCYIECKETAEGKPFRLSRIAGHQIDWLAAFDGLSIKFEGWVALGWRAKGHPMESALVMVPVSKVAVYEAEHGRKSIPMDEARQMGTECPRLVRMRSGKREYLWDLSRVLW
ncbi:hypothetical protein VJ923_06060 [Adlercreutzia sp. R25]|uniref:Holliday junction resolvase n=1 Tax=Adlercreutzia shanghongiae TaxID=3111773 RepID=A0ABU6IXY8_9ACTN|nr:MULTISPECIES: hypothetical protein [unclassified Adlercreutzia]MEC4272716.1 hypothetical protein [Adlercreutzia sp. R25]MEC4294384.1 hypothetical protein [Adlercreutzia sp. R22]